MSAAAPPGGARRAGPPTPPAPRRLGPRDPALPAVLALIRDVFAAHEGRIDPPSSAGRLTLDALSRMEVWAIGEPPEAAVVLTPRADGLHLGKLAVRADRRREGHARALVERAAGRARAMGLAALVLQSRVELAEAHRAFEAMGFERTGTTSHPGFERPTSVTFRRALP